MQYTVEKWYMVVGTLSLVQKGQTSGCIMQYAACSGIVVYGSGDIVFDARRSNQWIQWIQSQSGHSTQWTQWTQYAVDTAHSGCSTQWTQ